MLDHSPDLESLFAEWDSSTAPGFVISVIRHGDLVGQHACGMADLEHGEPMSPDSVFYIASVSKQFTAASVLLLTEDGTVDLDDPIRQYFPELHHCADPVTVRHLLHHTSGLRDYLDLWQSAGRSFEDPFGNGDGLELLTRQTGLNFAPGDEHLYCNSGYKLLAELVGRVSGSSLRHYADRRIFALLGMKHTLFDDDNAEVLHRVRSYEPVDEESFREVEKQFTIVGSGGLLTTVGDLSRWDANFDDPCVGGPQFIEALLTRGRLNDGTELDYACGLEHGIWKGLPVIGHGGGMLGFRTWMARFPEQRFTVICLANRADLDASGLGHAAADVFLAPEYPLPQYAGAYRSEELDSTWVLEVEGADLVLRHPEPLADSLASSGADAFVLGERQLSFQRQEGVVTGFSLGASRAQGVCFQRCPDGALPS